MIPASQIWQQTIYIDDNAVHGYTYRDAFFYCCMCCLFTQIELLPDKRGCISYTMHPRSEGSCFTRHRYCDITVFKYLCFTLFSANISTYPSNSHSQFYRGEHHERNRKGFATIVQHKRPIANVHDDRRQRNKYLCLRRQPGSHSTSVAILPEYDVYHDRTPAVR